MSKMKWVAFLGVSVVFLVSVFLLKSISENAELSTTYRRLLGSVRGFQDLHLYLNSRGINQGPSSYPRPLPSSHARRKYPCNFEGWCGWLAQNDKKPEVTLANLRTRVHKLLCEATDYVTYTVQLLVPSFDLFPSLGQAPHQSFAKPSKTDRAKVAPLAPALYVFGDSLSDSGNNNFLQTQAKVNYTPYGIDFPFGTTGRFSNGKTFVDFIAELLGLPFAPPYLGLSTNDKNKITTGVNYASGSAGILPETGTVKGGNLYFGKQIKYFQQTVTRDLLKSFERPAELSKYLSKSILVISIGNNDYINNYLLPADYESSRIYTAQQFADLLVAELKQGIVELYSLGGRKFVVFNIGRIGCIPNTVNNLNPKHNTPCVEDVNNLALLFNARLFNMIKDLEQTLVGSIFVHGDSYNAVKISLKSGLNIAYSPCCELDSSGLCLQDQVPCQDRTSHEYWDAFHPTEIVYDRLASDCFYGSLACAPINVQQLTQK